MLRARQWDCDAFKVPVAHVWKDMAILMQNGLGALPPSALHFAGAFGALGCLLPVLETYGPRKLHAVLPKMISLNLNFAASVRVLGAMAAGGAMRVYANDDVMVGIWLLGHRVDRARLVAKEYLDMWYQTSLSQCTTYSRNTEST